MAIREDILSAVLEAKRLHMRFDSESRSDRGEGRIDVFGMLVDLDIPVMFRPLTNLLGAFIDEPDRGVIVTTRRRLPIQRFTAAHELGHAALGHEASIDEKEILTRALFDNGANYDPREVQANAFAAALLSPPWLIKSHMERQGWSRNDLVDPVVVYQLSLRMGTSFSATCHALFDCKGVDRPTYEKLLQTSNKKRLIKKTLVDPYVPSNLYGDVWVLTERDNGVSIECCHNDILVIKVNEHSSSGYVWQFDDLAKAGLLIRGDWRASEGNLHIGGVVYRKLIAEAKGSGTCRFSFREIRPWQASGSPLNSMDLDIDFSGPLTAGLHPVQREALLEVA